MPEAIDARNGTCTDVSHKKTALRGRARIDRRRLFLLKILGMPRTRMVKNECTCMYMYHLSNPYLNRCRQYSLADPLHETVNRSRPLIEGSWSQLECRTSRKTEYDRKRNDKHRAISRGQFPLLLVTFATPRRVLIQTAWSLCSLGHAGPVSFSLAFLFAFLMLSYFLFCPLLSAKTYRPPTLRQT
jgi:hypothetical protein